MNPFPHPDATMAEIAAWFLANDPRWSEVCAWCDHARRDHLPASRKAGSGACDEFTEHEAPPMENGPSIVCNACGKVRINMFVAPFCKRCLGVIGCAM